METLARPPMMGHKVLGQAAAATTGEMLGRLAAAATEVLQEAWAWLAVVEEEVLGHLPAEPIQALGRGLQRLQRQRTKHRPRLLHAIFNKTQI
ncbi:UNVERIFIED_CONTAM: hypothetical protein K2H54_055686 [Gekko kuhli]